MPTQVVEAVLAVDSWEASSVAVPNPTAAIQAALTPACGAIKAVLTALVEQTALTKLVVATLAIQHADVTTVLAMAAPRTVAESLETLVAGTAVAEMAIAVVAKTALEWQA